MLKDSHTRELGEAQCHADVESPNAIGASAFDASLPAGCVIGEAAGLFIGVSLGIGVFWTIVWPLDWSTLADYVSVISLIESWVDLKGAMRVVWLGELVSITVMEIAMNAQTIGLVVCRRVPFWHRFFGLDWV